MSPSDLKTILFVSIVFPPKFDSEGLQVARYFKYLKRHAASEFEFDVVTSRSPTLYMPEMDALKPIAEGVRRRIELPVFENKYSNFILRKISSGLIDRPDSKFSFHLQWKRALRQLPAVPDVIYSRSFPASSALLAMKLKKKLASPWIMHLSDLWADSPFKPYDDRTMTLNQEMEAECFALADYVCLTSKSTIAFYIKKYPQHAAKFKFFPNVYDPEDIIVEQPVKNGSSLLRIVHTGLLGTNRSPDPIVEIANSLPARLEGRVKIELFGAVDRLGQSIINRANPKFLTYHGPVHVERALREQRAADILLLLDVQVAEPEKRVYFMSKILDYMIAKRYVLALSDVDSECTQQVEGKLGRCFRFDDTAGVCNHLEELLERKSLEAQSIAQDAIDTRFSADHNAARLLRLIETLV